MKISSQNPSTPVSNFMSNRQIRTEFTRTKILEITTSEFLLDANVRELRAKIVYCWIFYYDITGS